MSSKRFRLGRRTLLRGAGAALALPVLEAMLDGKGGLYGAAHAADPAPVRLITMFNPNGTHMPNWTPAQSGPMAAFGTPILKPLDTLGVSSQVNVISGITSNAAILSKGVGDGAHERGTGTFGVGLPITNTSSGGISVDQYAAAALGGATHRRSVPVSDDRAIASVQLSNISWDAAGNPVPAKRSPQELFDHLFADFSGGGTDGGITPANARRLNVLDRVKGDIDRLKGSGLGAADQARLDNHLTLVEEMERQLRFVPSVACSPPGTPANYSALLQTPARRKLYVDLMVSALECDITRFLSFQLRNGGGGLTFPWLASQLNNKTMGYHSISHLTDAAGFSDKTVVSRDEIEIFAYLVKQLADRKDPTGKALIESTFVLYSSEMSNGAGHDYKNLPVLLAGRVNGTVAGRHLVTSGKYTGNLYLSILQRMGLPVTSFAGATSGIAL